MDNTISHAWQYSECSYVHPIVIMKEEITFIVTEFVDFPKNEMVNCENLFPRFAVVLSLVKV